MGEEGAEDPARGPNRKKPNNECGTTRHADPNRAAQTTGERRRKIKSADPLFLSSQPDLTQSPSRDSTLKLTDNPPLQDSPPELTRHLVLLSQKHL